MKQCIQPLITYELCLKIYLLYPCRCLVHKDTYYIKKWYIKNVELHEKIKSNRIGMYLVKGFNSVKEQILSILSSVDLKEERLLLYLDKWYNDTDIDTDIDAKMYKCKN